MKILANVIGILAVIMFVVSYQLKSRRSIIFFNAGSRILYIAQYILLGAFEGALLDMIAFLISLIYRAKDTKRSFISTIREWSKISVIWNSGAGSAMKRFGT